MKIRRTSPLKNPFGAADQNYSLSAEITTGGQRKIMVGSWLLDVRDNAVYFSPEVLQMLGLQKTELGTSLDKYHSFVHPADTKRVKSAAKAALAGREHELEYRMFSKDGREKYIREKTKAVHDQKGRLSKIIGVVEDLSGERAAGEKSPAYVAVQSEGQKAPYLKDPLTGLPNRLALITELKTLSQQVKTRGGSFALFMLDLSHLINIRDTLGYKIGEQYINQVAKKLLNYCGGEGCLYRFASLRFCLIIAGSKTMAEYKSIIAEILALFKEPEKVGPYDLNVELSIGVSIYKKDGGGLEQLIRQAENALYQARAGGKKYEFYSADLDILSHKKFILRNGLSLALAREQLQVYYQPIVDLRSFEILAVQAQIRWDHPEWGLLSPPEFISLAEETGRIIEMGHWLLAESSRTYKRWLAKEYPAVKLAMNFSPVQFLARGFANKMEQLIAANGLDAAFLIMEIKESMLIARPQEVVAEFAELQSLGIQIALDDFGTGYSSLAYLNTFNLDYLKLGRFFTQDLMQGGPGEIILSHVIELSRKLGLKVMAAGIENEKQLAALQQLGCFAGQGPLFGEAQPAGNFELLLARRFAQPVLPDGRRLRAERRKAFRISFRRYLEADLTITEMKGRKLDIGSTKVLVKDIGPGGLRFASDIRFPKDRGMVFKFTTELMGEEITVLGRIVWVNAFEDGLFEYGVEFSMSENLVTALVKVLNKVQSEMLRETLFTAGRFVANSPAGYFN